MAGLGMKSSVYCFNGNRLEFLMCCVSTFVQLPQIPQVNFLKTYLGYLLL